MHVRSIPGQGTVFTIILPLAQPPDVQKRRERVPIERHKLNFLVIDDEVNILKMMEMFFEDTEVDIFTALTAEEGLRAIRRDEFDAVLCDLGMDDMNGLEVGQKVKEYFQNAGKPKIPFLLYTGLENELDSQKLSDHGIDRVVKKPIPCEDLLRLIQSLAVPPVQAKYTGA
jgi:CheY-like chemotaxis protein